jgi:hypothetical protein
MRQVVYLVLSLLEESLIYILEDFNTNFNVFLSHKEGYVSIFIVLCARLAAWRWWEGRQPTHCMWGRTG